MGRQERGEDAGMHTVGIAQWGVMLVMARGRKIGGLEGWVGDMLYFCVLTRLGCIPAPCEASRPNLSAESSFLYSEMRGV